MNVQDQIAAVKAATSLDLTAVNEDIADIMTTTNEKTAALKQSAEVKKAAGYSTGDETRLIQTLEKESTDKIRGLVFGAFITKHGKARVAAADLFFSLDGWN